MILGKLRNIDCPRCGEQVRIPLYWVFGVEGIFRCKSCNKRFKIHFALGAFLSALGLLAGITALQIFGFIFGVTLAVILVVGVIPISIFTGFILRRKFVVRRAEREVKKFNESSEKRDN